MKRDTAIVIQDAVLYQSYLTRILNLKRDYSADILHSHHADFERKVTEYEFAHRKTFGQMLFSRQLNIGSKQRASVDFLEWITQEKSQILPLFIWGRKLDDKEQLEFEQKVIPIVNENNESIGEFYVVGAYDGSLKKQDYHNGGIILTMNSSGHYIEFDFADIVTHALGKWWLCGLSSRVFSKPFMLTPTLKKIIHQKHYERAGLGKMYLDSKDLRELANALRANQP